MNKQWITAWSKSQRGMGLVSHLFDSHQVIKLHIPKTSQLCFRFSSWYDIQEITLHDVVCIYHDKQEQVTFHGTDSITIKPQSCIQSDIVKVSREITECTLQFTIESDHPVSSAIQLVSDPVDPAYDQVSALNNLIYVFSGVDVVSEERTYNVSVIGDSITEQSNWTSYISRYLQPHGIGFINHGISGNRLCRELTQVTLTPELAEMFQKSTDHTRLGEHTGIALPNQCFGIAGNKRFSQQILPYDKRVNLMIFALGTNDLYQPGTFCAPMSELVQVDEFMNAYRPLFEQAKQAGLKTMALCIPGLHGCESWSLEKEQIRMSINAQLQKEPHLDYVVNFDEVLCNEQHGLKEEYHHGDHLHPNLAGGKVMARCIQKELETWLG